MGRKRLGPSGSDDFNRRHSGSTSILPSPAQSSHLQRTTLKPPSTNPPKTTMATLTALRRALYHASPPKPTTRTLSSTTTFRLPSSSDNNPDSSSSRSIPFSRSPSPPRLPKEEQEIFEKLQAQSTGAFSTPKINQSPDSDAGVQFSAEEGDGGSEAMHPDARGGVKPEFEGETNPKTGEVGGPKNEPLRWGSRGDWSYGGRVTDF